MVFIEIKSAYLAQFKNNSGLSNIIDYIFENKNSTGSHNDVQNPEYAVNSLIASIINNDLQKYSQIEELYKRKRPEITSPWINNNYLIYLLLIGAEKFNKEKDWLKEAIAVRKSTDLENTLILDFFASIISNSLYHQGGIAPLLVSYSYLSNPAKVFPEVVQAALEQLRQTCVFPCFNNEFLNIIYLNAFEIILDLKDIRDVKLDIKVSEFKARFQNKISRIANLIVYFMFLLILIGIYFAIKYLLFNLNEFLRNIIVTALGLIGFTALEIFKGRKAFKQKLEDFLKNLLGFNLLGSEL